MKICCVVPAYNEASREGGRFFRATLTAIQQYVRNYQQSAVVVNDGSTDQSLDIIREYPLLGLSQSICNKGKIAAFERGYRYAHRRESDILVTVDADMQDLTAQHIDAVVNTLIASPEHMAVATYSQQGNAVGSKYSGFRAMQTKALSFLQETDSWEFAIWQHYRNAGGYTLEVAQLHLVSSTPTVLDLSLESARRGSLNSIESIRNDVSRAWQIFYNLDEVGAMKAQYML